MEKHRWKHMDGPKTSKGLKEKGVKRRRKKQRQKEEERLTEGKYKETQERTKRNQEIGRI